MVHGIAHSVAFAVGITALLQIALGYLLTLLLFDRLGADLWRESAQTAELSGGAGTLRHNLPNFSAYARSLDFILSYLLWSTPSVLLLVVLGRASFRIFSSFLLAHARQLSNRVGRFSEGRLDERFAPGEFPEYERLAETFNRMAAVISSRIRQREADRSDRQELLAGLAHDLRTPMAVIQGCAARLLGAEASEEQRRQYRETLQRNVDVQCEYTKLFEELSAVEHVPTNAKSRFDIHDLLEESVALIRVSAVGAGVELSLQRSAVPIDYWADRLLLRRAVLNLLDNAIRHSEPGGQVEVSASRRFDGAVILRVKNSGRPVPSSVRLSLDSPKPDTKIVRGRLGGLGLFIVRRIAQRLDGEAVLLEEREGANCFEMVLPALCDGAREVRSAEAERPPVPRAPVRLTGWLTVFSISLMGVGEALFPANAAVRSLAVLLLILLGAASRPTSSQEFRSSSSVVISLVLMLLLIVEPRPSFQAGIGAALLQACVHIFRIEPNPLSRLLGAALPLLASLFSLGSAPWLFLLGVLVGGWVSLVAWLADTSRSVRRAGVWLGALLLISSGVSTFCQGAALYAFLVRSVKQLGEQTSANALSSVLPEMRRALERGETPKALLEAAYAVDPIHGFVVDEADGRRSATVGVEDKNQSIRSSDFRRSLLSTRVCVAPSCPTLGVYTPSSRINSILHRVASPLFLLLILFELHFSWLMLALYSSRWRNAIVERIGRLLEGIERYAAGEYSSRIDLDADDEIGELASKLNSLAEKISSLELEYLESRSVQCRFLETASAALKECVADLKEDHSSARLESLSEAVSILDEAIELLFSVAALDLEGEETDSEAFPLEEYLMEEIEMAQRLHARSVRHEFGEGRAAPIASGPLKAYLLGLRYLLQRACESAGEEASLRSFLMTESERHRVTLEVLKKEVLKTKAQGRRERRLRALRELFADRVSSRLETFGGSLELPAAGTEHASESLRFSICVRALPSTGGAE